MKKNILNDLLNTQGHISENELNAYLGGNAPSGVRHKVENAMLDDSLYSDAVEGYQEMGFATIPTLEDFSDFKKKLPAPGGAKIIQLTPVQKLMRVAAVAGVLLLGIFAYNAFQSPTPASLYADYYTHYENDISLTRRGDADGLNKDFKNALGLYATGKFDKAMPYFKKALQAEPSNDAAHFFSGIACMEMGNHKDAATHLNTVKKNNGTYSEKAFWYVILATLKSGDVESAKKMLREFKGFTNYKKEEAKRLLEKL